MLLLIILCTVLLLAVVNDWRSQRIPNWLTLSAAASGMALHFAVGGAGGLLFSLAGLFLGMAMLMLFYLSGGLGGGDVKLMGAVGALLGPKGVFAAFLLTALAGGVYAILLLMVHGQLTHTLKRYGLMLKTVFLTRKVFYVPPSEGERAPRLRYGLAIALGTIISVVLKNHLYGMLHLD